MGNGSGIKDVGIPAPNCESGFVVDMEKKYSKCIYYIFANGRKIQKDKFFQSQTKESDK